MILNNPSAKIMDKVDITIFSLYGKIVPALDYAWCPDKKTTLVAIYF